MSEPEIQGGQPEAPAPEAPAEQPAQEPAKPSLAETIRQARAEREARAAAESARSDLAAKLAAAEARAAAAEAAASAADPIQIARARKLSREQQAEWGKALLYDLVPEEAPADYRVTMLERRLAEKEEAAKAEREAERRAQQQAYLNQQLESYRATVQSAAQTFPAGSHPESEAWFGDDRRAYAASLLATADNLAKAANQSGQRANLDPAHVAGVLEAEVAGRMKARDARRGKAQNRDDAEGAQTPSESGRTAGQPTSTKGLSSGGPRSPAKSDRERIARAVAAAFPTKSA